MGDRINQDYQWFYDAHIDFAFESYLLDMAKASGDYSLFNDYLSIVYMNDRDYFFQWVNNVSDHQNSTNDYREIPLLNSKSAERVAELNQENFKTAFDKYKADLAEKEKYYGDIADFISIKGNDDELWKILTGDIKLQEEFGYKPLLFESIYMVGCMFMSTKYGLEAITGKYFDTIALNEYIKENNLYLRESDLSNELMARIMTELSDGQYSVTLAENGLIDPAKLYGYEQSNDMYLAHLRIKKDGTGDGYHSVMVSGIDYAFDKNGNITGINAVNVANPWNSSNSFSGKTSYTMDQIARWDIFKVTPIKQTTSVGIYYPTNHNKMLDYYR
jgi:hypothetical protein